MVAGLIAALLIPAFVIVATRNNGATDVKAFNWKGTVDQDGNVVETEFTN